MSEHEENIFPEGYERFICPICAAGCIFKAMNWCEKHRAGECGIHKDVEFNGGAFKLMVKSSLSKGISNERYSF